MGITLSDREGVTHSRIDSVKLSRIPRENRVVKTE